MIPFRLRRDGNQLVICTHHYANLTHTWQPTITLDRIWAANLAAELDAWLNGTDEIPHLEAGL